MYFAKTIFFLRTNFICKNILAPLLKKFGFVKKIDSIKKISPCKKTSFVKKVYLAKKNSFCKKNISFCKK